MRKKLKLKYPFEYYLEPRQIEKGTHWLSLYLKNKSEEVLKFLDIKLNSLDSYNLTNIESDLFIDKLKPEKKEFIPFKINANSSGSVYVSVDGFENDQKIHWESPFIKINVGQDPAKLSSLFILTEPYPPVGKLMHCEVVIKALRNVNDLKLEFWLRDPDLKFKELDTIKIKDLSSGTTKRLSASFKPKIDGLFTVHAYLYIKQRKIGHETDKVWVEK
jgi:hypothetical protein